MIRFVVKCNFVNRLNILIDIYNNPVARSSRRLQTGLYLGMMRVQLRRLSYCIALVRPSIADIGFGTRFLMDHHCHTVRAAGLFPHVISHC